MDGAASGNYSAELSALVWVGVSVWVGVPVVVGVPARRGRIFTPVAAARRATTNDSTTKLAPTVAIAVAPADAPAAPI